MKIDWKQKLSSRKFWVGLGGMIAGVYLMVTGDENTAKIIAGAVVELASSIGYLWAETCVDVSRNE